MRLRVSYIACTFYCLISVEPIVINYFPARALFRQTYLIRNKSTLQIAGYNLISSNMYISCNVQFLIPSPYVNHYINPVISLTGFLSSLCEDLRFSAGVLNRKIPFRVCFIRYFYLKCFGSKLAAAGGTCNHRRRPVVWERSSCSFLSNKDSVN